MAELIVALDFAEKSDLMHCAQTLSGTLGWCKVGLEAFVREGPSLLAELEDLGFRIFLDLKFHDIPNTVAAAVRSAVACHADILTIHTQGGEQMVRGALQAAREAADRHNRPVPLIFGVTILTSLGDGSLPLLTMRSSHAAMALAMLADSWGLDGVVCSGQEAASIKASTSLKVLCPGIRPLGSSADDQSRVVTPAMAVAAGADYLVVGRPITRSQDPKEAAQKILAEIREASGHAPAEPAAAADPADETDAADTK